MIENARRDGNTSTDQHRCVCGNNGHISLEEWYRDYLGSIDFRTSEAEYESDSFDKEKVEEQVRGLMSQVTVSNGYCTKCRDLLASWPEIMNSAPKHFYGENDDIADFQEFHHRPYFRSVVELVASQRTKCRLCILLAESVVDKDHTLDMLYKIERRLICLGKPSALSISLGILDNGYALNLNRPGFFSCSDRPMNPLYISRVKPACEKAGSTILLQAPTQLDLAKRWLGDCVANHAWCKGYEYYPLPTRLLSVGTKLVKLVETKCWETRLKYATLSHCWGKADFLKLENATLKSFMTALPIEKLTKTFQDAIEITRRLGLEYLWIDSLCIIQDSSLDWKVESGMMSFVYRGSMINIAAAGAIDGSWGCFLKPNDYVGKVHVEAKSTRFDNLVGWDIAPDTFYDSVAMSHLSNRAWALQERILPPRTLYFTSKELFWGCRLRDAGESFPEGLPDICRNRHYFHLRKGSIYSNWIPIVHLYTSADLTYRTDKLVALSGIARAAQEESNDQYLAGLWRQNIEHQLCWRKFSHSSRLPQSERYLAPTWSWASMDDTVTYNYTYDIGIIRSHTYAHVYDASITPSGLDPFGAVSAGALSLSCTSILCGTLYKNRSHYGSYVNWEILSPEGSKIIPRASFDFDAHDGYSVLILPLIYAFSKPESQASETGYENGWLEGILLEPTRDQKGEYRRVGHFSILQRHEATDVQNLLRRMRESGPEIAEAGCAEVLAEPEFPDERYVITIV